MDDKDKVEIIHQPISGIKEKIGGGADLRRVLQSGLVEEAQEIINGRQQEFLAWMETDLRAMEEVYGTLQASGGSDPEQLASMRRLALSVKSRGGTFGFDLASMVAKLLHDFCDRPLPLEKQHLQVIRKHLDGLKTIFQHNIVKDGGAVGAELIGSLRQLVEKYKS